MKLVNTKIKLGGGGKEIGQKGYIHTFMYIKYIHTFTNICHRGWSNIQ